MTRTPTNRNSGLMPFYSEQRVQEAIDRATISQNQLNDTFNAMAAVIHRIDESVRYRNVLPRDVLVKRLEELGVYLVQTARHFKNKALPFEDTLQPGYLNYVTQIVSALNSGIDAVLKGEDNGDQLAQIYKDNPLNAPFEQYMYGRKGPGRRKGKTEGREWLKQRWLELANTSLTPGAIRLQILSEIAERDSHRKEWVLLPCNPDDKEARKAALKSLTSATAEKNPEKYQYDLLNK